VGGFDRARRQRTHPRRLAISDSRSADGASCCPFRRRTGRNDRMPTEGLIASLASSRAQKIASASLALDGLAPSSFECRAPLVSEPSFWPALNECQPIAPSGSIDRPREAPTHVYVAVNAESKDLKLENLKLRIVGFMASGIGVNRGRVRRCGPRGPMRNRVLSSSDKLYGQSRTARARKHVAIPCFFRLPARIGHLSMTSHTKQAVASTEICRELLG